MYQNTHFKTDRCESHIPNLCSRDIEGVLCKSEEAIRKIRRCDYHPDNRPNADAGTARGVHQFYFKVL